MNELLLPIGLVIGIAVIVFLFRRSSKKRRNSPVVSKKSYTPVPDQQAAEEALKASQLEALAKAKQSSNTKQSEVQEDIAKPKRKSSTKKSEVEGKKSKPKKTLQKKAPKKQ